MKKRLFYMLVSVVLIASISACSLQSNPTLKYINAFVKTNDADSMEEKTEFKINIDLSKASDEVKSEFEKFKEITLNMDGALDNKGKKWRINTFLGAGDIMMNPVVYGEGEKVYMKLNEKYVDLSKMKGAKENSSKPSYEEYGKLYGEFSTIWKDAIANEILSSEGNSILYTPDGDIKVTQLSLELNDEKQKNIVRKIAEAVSKNDAIKNTIAKISKNFKQEGINQEESEKKLKDWLDNLPGNIKDSEKKYSLENLKLSAKVDKDSYIIDETIQGTIVIKHKGEIGIGFKVHITRWNINNNSIKVEMPEINEKNLMDMKEFEAKYSVFYDKSKNDIKTAD
ncbi:MAG: hypothetical protein N3I35_08055 [Clostridia bacterium]|nr:hypothetical protein [Clostridia bacterium]